MNVIEVNDVSKKFRLGATTGDLRDRFSSLFSRRPPEKATNDFWALRDISFNVAEGESFGIIGHNGSGKSTLLKLITGIYTPTSGTFKTRGRVSALIEVGAGFHPDLTGRENVYLNGSVMGLKKREIDKKFDEIVAFSELEQFIDTPVKRYSSGMYMRLGFAVAAHVDPDIVLVDEVLAVGDESFQQKCMKRMHDLRREGKTIVFISHSMDAISALCQKVMLLSHGEMLTIGEPKDVVTAYRVSLAADRDRRGQASLEVVPEHGQPKDLEILRVRLLDEAGRECDTINIGDPVRLECDFRANIPVEDPAFGVAINRDDGLYIFGPNTKFDGFPVGRVSGEGTFSITYPSMILMQGVYHFMVATFRQDDTHHSIDNHPQAATLTITSPMLNHGVVALPHTWDVSTGQEMPRQEHLGMTAADLTEVREVAVGGGTRA